MAFLGASTIVRVNTPPLAIGSPVGGVLRGRIRGVVALRALKIGDCYVCAAAYATSPRLSGDSRQPLPSTPDRGDVAHAAAIDG
jgi:hypothetical protein